jgi:hypothetical protein
MSMTVAIVRSWSAFERREGREDLVLIVALSVAFILSMFGN